MKSNIENYKLVELALGIINNESTMLNEDITTNFRKLVNQGLLDNKDELVDFMRAIKVIRDGGTPTQEQRAKIFDLFLKLLDMVTGPLLIQTSQYLKKNTISPP